MSRSEWLVAIAGVALIVWINWYFLLADTRAGTTAAPPTDGP